MQYIWLWGWHVLTSIIENNSRKIKKILILEKHYEKVKKIINNVQIEFASENTLNKMFGLNHQGVAIYVEQIKFWELNEWIEKQNHKSFLIACDLIEDPHNLGAIIRTGAAFGANGLLITKKKSAPFLGSLAKSAAGGLEFLDIIQVSNLVNSLQKLQQNNFHVYGLDERGNNIWNKKDKCVLVLGQEGNGLRQLTKKTCDDTISINTKKNFGVLNVSVAAGIAISRLLD